jgi:hypothetical protein
MLAPKEEGGVMAVLSHPKPAPDVLSRQSEFRVIESAQRVAHT